MKNTRNSSIFSVRLDKRHLVDLAKDFDLLLEIGVLYCERIELILKTPYWQDLRKDLCQIRKDWKVDVTDDENAENDERTRDGGRAVLFHTPSPRTDTHR